MEELLLEYQNLLATVDDWFTRAQLHAGDQMCCAPGCSACCRGLFDITLLDARLLQQGFVRLPVAVRRAVLASARERLADLQATWHALPHPYTLNHLPDSEWTVMPEEDETPCPLLIDGRCAVYAHRPLICRTHGLPHIDVNGEVFDDSWCTRNFPAVDPLAMPELRWHFRAVYEAEIALFRRFTERLLGEPRNELDTFIPTALLIDFDHWTPVS